MKIIKSNVLYLRDVYLAYLIDGAQKSSPDGFPIIEKWMVADAPPEHLYQWDRRKDCKDFSKSGMSFYCVDYKLTPILNNPKNYVDKLKKYNCIIGMDASPYDNMWPIIQDHQIFLNLAITYYFGKQGLKIVPNVRLGSDRTISSLSAYPKETLISVGTNGFIHELKNREIYKRQISIIVEVLKPTGIIVYGPAPEYVFEKAIESKIPIYQYDSYNMKRYKNKKVEGKHNEGR